MTLEPDLDPSIVSSTYFTYIYVQYPKANTSKIDLPPNCRVVSNTRHGSSFWANTSTGRISVILQDGTPQSYFIKVLTGEVGRNILHGEYESMKTIHAVTPDYAPTPVAWGTYTQDPNVHFFLCEYRTMTPPGDQMPDPVPFTQRLSALHMQSGGEAQAQTSPGKKRFGFHVPTYSGYLPQYTGWEDSWEVFFAKSLRVALDLEIRAKGPDPEFDTLVPAIFESVIPRLLRPLESDGRSVKPSLVHGDLWYGNSGVDRDTGECLVFDACCFYAHNECMSPSGTKDRMWLLS